MRSIVWKRALMQETVAIDADVPRLSKAMFYGLEKSITSEMAELPLEEVSVVELPPYLIPEKANRIKARVHHQDFLVVTEFTEDIGPVPLRDCTFPKRELIETSTFKLDTFATKLMSADYFAQANNQELNFRMPEDMHALISDSTSDCYTLLYAFTLYDIQGRGYVRPLYLAYTTHERDKLTRIYNYLVDHISQAVHKLVHSNVIKFYCELIEQQRKQNQAHEAELLEHEATSCEKTIYDQTVCDRVKEHLDSEAYDRCGCTQLNTPQPAPPKVKMQKLKMSEDSETMSNSFENINMDGERSLRDITEISNCWDQFRADLNRIHQIFMRSYADILRSQIHSYIGSPDEACDCLNVGGLPLALLRIHDHSKHARSITSSHKTSTISIESRESLESNQNSLLTQNPPTSQSSFSSGPSSITSDGGIESLPSDQCSSLTSDLNPSLTSDQYSSLTSDGPSSLTSDPEPDNAYSDPDLQDSHTSTVKAYRTGSLVSADVSFTSIGSSVDDIYFGSDLDLSTLQICSVDSHHFKGMREVLCDHSSHIRDLIFTVMASRPLVIQSSSTDAKAEQLAIFLEAFIPRQHQAHESTFLPQVVTEEELTLKSICKNPLIIYRTTGKQQKISENVRVFASIYNLNLDKINKTQKYMGIPYGKDRGLLDVFIDRKKRRKYKDFKSLVGSMLMQFACKVQLLHTLNQKATGQMATEKSHKRAEKMMRDLGLENPSDLTIIKNLVHTVIKQQYISSQGLKDEAITSMSMLLTRC